jgi:hypothetical protein
MGDRGRFEANLAARGAGKNVEIIAASSLDLDAMGFVAAGKRFRIFSIDGGHTAEVTCNDLEVAERTIVDSGVVILDDLLNPAWLGVITGLFDYWHAGGSLVPAVLVPNKLFLASSPDEAKACRELMEEHFSPAVKKRDVPLGRHVVDVYGELPWTVVDVEGGAADLAAASRPAREPAKPVARSLPVSELEDLERRAREGDVYRRRVSRGEVPLRKVLARRFPRMSAAQRTLVRVARSRRG